MSISVNDLPASFRNNIMQGEDVKAVTSIHKMWMMAWLLNPIYWAVVLFTGGVALLILLYKAHLIKNTVMIVTNKRIIGSVSPKLFTKDKVDLQVKSIDNIAENATIFGNIFGWTMLTVTTRSDKYEIKMITKESAKAFKSEFYSLT